MLIQHLSASGYNTADACEMKWFIANVLKWRLPSPWKATDIGTIVHSVLEVLANAKMTKQAGKGRFEDPVIGTVTFSKLFDADYLEKIIEKVYYDFTANPEKPTKHDWNSDDLKMCKKHVQKVLDYNDGNYNPLNCNIVGSEIEFVPTLDYEWAKYRHEFDGRIIEGNLQLRGFIDLVVEVDSNTYEIRDWKGLPVETKIPTIDGWKTMGELLVGDIVFDQDGNQTNVIGKSIASEKPCYKITFDDTTEVICDSEHLWKLDNGTVLPVTELKIKDKINVTKPIVCSKVQLPIDPYVLGIWLGDGRNANGEISNTDNFIFEEIERRGYSLGDNINKKGTCPSKTVYGLMTELKKLELLHNKHIPSIYFRASIEQRLDLLRGLMDSDGNVNSVRKQAVFTNCNKKLSDDTKTLILSLGQRVNQSHIIAHGFGLDVDAYPLHFKPIDINPFLLPRKADKIKSDWGYGRCKKRQIRKIELIENKITQCIMVDSPSHTYLCTENFIPTHNTGKTRKDFNTGKMKEYDDLVDDIQLRMYHYAATLLFPAIENILVTIFYIQAGGPFTISYCKDDIPKTLDMIKTKFEKIKAIGVPQKNVTWQCRKSCEYGLNTFEGTEIPVLKSTKKTHCCGSGDPHKICSQVDYVMQHRSMDSVIKNLSKPSSSLLATPEELE
jgi:intein/homing endonuclease